MNKDILQDRLTEQESGENISMLTSNKSKFLNNKKSTIKTSHSNSLLKTKKTCSNKKIHFKNDTKFNELDRKFNNLQTALINSRNHSNEANKTNNVILKICERSGKKLKALNKKNKEEKRELLKSK